MDGVEVELEFCCQFIEGVFVVLFVFEALGEPPMQVPKMGVLVFDDGVDEIEEMLVGFALAVTECGELAAYFVGQAQHQSRRVAAQFLLLASPHLLLFTAATHETHLRQRQFRIAIS